MQSKASITAIVLTLNEELNIERCLQSIAGLCSQIYLVDSGSTDKTIDIAKKYNVNIVYHEFTSYSAQFNWALDNLEISNEWILRLDADEVITNELSEEIKKELGSNSSQEVNGYVIRQKIYFLGRFMKHGGAYPFRKLMLFRYGIGRIEDKYMDEHTILKFGHSKELKCDGEHYDFKSIDIYIRKMNWYASREVNDFILGYKLEGNYSIADKKINNKRFKKSLYYNFPMFIRAWILYVYRFYFLLGFLDGKEGRIFHFLQAYWYRFLVDAKILEKIIVNKDLSVTKTGKLG